MKQGCHVKSCFTPNCSCFSLIPDSCELYSYTKIWVMNNTPRSGWWTLHQDLGDGTLHQDLGDGHYTKIWVMDTTPRSGWWTLDQDLGDGLWVTDSTPRSGWWTLHQDMGDGLVRCKTQTPGRWRIIVHVKNGNPFCYLPTHHISVQFLLWC